MSNSSGVDSVFEALSDIYRRRLLVALLDHNPQDGDNPDPLTRASDEVEPEALQTELLHNYLPKLEETVCISWNKDSNEISKGPNWDEIEPLLTLIQNHQDEPPDGWL